VLGGSQRALRGSLTAIRIRSIVKSIRERIRRTAEPAPASASPEPFAPTDRVPAHPRPRKIAARRAKGAASTRSAATAILARRINVRPGSVGSAPSAREEATAARGRVATIVAPISIVARRRVPCAVETNASHPRAAFLGSYAGRSASTRRRIRATATAAAMRAAREGRARRTNALRAGS
jgi:hypothetical protein